MPLEEELVHVQEKLEKEIKTKLIERDLTQAQVARSLRVSRDAVSRAISGDGKPQSREIRKRLYKILGMECE